MDILDKQLKKGKIIVRLKINDNSLIKTKLPKYTKVINEIVDLDFKDDYYLKQVTFMYYLPTTYEDLVNQLVKERYSDSEEFAILRKAVKEVTDEFLIYNSFVEECKVKAKEFIAEREGALNE